MFTCALYDHIFDIDDIITALCGGNGPAARCLLCTRDGSIIEEAEGASAVPTAHIKDGDDNGHWHVIVPFTSDFMAWLKREAAAVPAPLAGEVASLLARAATPVDLPGLFGHGPAGGWLRERVKDAALDWLDARDLIPPSMRHVRVPRQAAGGAIRVKID